MSGEAASEWGGEDWGGCVVVAEYVTYNFLERVRAPCFGTVETTMSGSKKVGLFLVLGWVYDADDPGVVVGIGHWGCDNPWLKKFFGVNLGAKSASGTASRLPATFAGRAMAPGRPPLQQLTVPGPPGAAREPPKPPNGRIPAHAICTAAGAPN